VTFIFLIRCVEMGGCDPCRLVFARVEAEAFEDVGVQFDDLFAREAHLFVGV
jgi:hypothetical protein